ncbi:UDP-glucuronic acid decarboxylase family protein [Roseibium sp.]|uniref:UDP-glucuronic acid decarboxylase family protein n=1 Tax=Roseibium sp. TaxID=1936156 RepID=UPI003A96A89D
MADGKRIVVTGGAGFLGSHICERLISRGENVVCVDNYMTGAFANVEHLVGNPNFSIIKHDVCDPLEIDGDVDEIFNFACPASPPRYQADPIYTTKISVIGALNMLNLAEAKGAKIIQASTSEVYGDPTVHPQTESYWGNVNSIGIRACYDEGKRCAETLFYEYHRCRDINIRVVRIFNTYGPRMSGDDGRVVSNFIVQALKGENITIYGDGSQTRSFCYRDDLVEGILRLMNAEDDVTFPVNIGNQGEFTIKELAEIVLELTGSRSEIKFLPLPQDDPLQRCPDISRAKKHLGWEPQVPLREGLKKTIAYFEQSFQHSFAAIAE